VTRQDLTLLVDYHYWARDRMLAAVEVLTPEEFTRHLVTSFPSVRDSVVHIYAAEWIWYRRWQGESPTALLAPEGFSDLTSVRTAWTALEADVRRLVAGLDDEDLQRVVEYRLMSGQPGASIFWQMLQHVVNHATYHRGQVTTLLRQLGAEPPMPTDLIAFYRERRPDRGVAG
jgi:uncharacterized damage-inducible protein DinB